MRILTIADLHTGCIPDAAYFLRVVTDIFDRELTLKRTDAVVFLGDFFDRIFKANDENIALAIDIMAYLTTLCRKNHVKLRLIYGTESHEMSQYQIFRHYLGQKDLDMRIIETVTDEELFKDVNVLYLPEEYVSDKAQYYGKYLNGDHRYDYIFGHGIVEEGWPTPLTDAPSVGKEKQVPHFKSKELLGAGKLVLFGHYHQHNEFYLGSLFRWMFGEDTPKGYGIIENGKLNFIENREAYQYRTYEYNSDSKIFSGVDQLKAELDRIRSENETVFTGKVDGKIRLKLNLPPDMDPSFTTNLNGMTSNMKSLRITSVIAPVAKTLTDEVADVIDDKYAFILDKAMPLKTKLLQFFQLEYPNVEITEADIDSLVD